MFPGLDVRVGQTLAGRYRVEERLGAGASGVVLAARHVHLRQEVTLKILAGYTAGQADVLARRVKKARLATRLENTHVARIVDVGTTEHGMPYVATERLVGRTLEQELDLRGRIPEAEAVRWIIEACEALAEAHALGMVHGDLKPSNLFLAEGKPLTTREKMKALGAGPGAGARGERGERDRQDGAGAGDGSARSLKVLDFGMTSAIDGMTEGASATAFFGSPAYLAPEQIQDPARVDARADLWALGVILYELLSGAPPFTADTVSGVLVAICFDAPAILTDAPYELAKIVHRCLEKDPHERPRDVLELARQLEPFAGTVGVALAERVRIALATRPKDDAERGGDGARGRGRARSGAGAGARSPDESGSISPVSVPLDADGAASPDAADSAEALPLVTRPATARAGWRPGARGAARGNGPETGPSRRVLARRRKITRAAALAMLAGAATVVGLTWRGLRADVAGAVGPTLERAGVDRALVDRAAGTAPLAEPVEIAPPEPDEGPGAPPPAPESNGTTTPTEVAQPVEHDVAIEPVPRSVEPPRSSDPPPRPPSRSPAIGAAPSPRNAAQASHASRGSKASPAPRLPAGLPSTREPSPRPPRRAPAPAHEHPRSHAHARTGHASTHGSTHASTHASGNTGADDPPKNLFSERK